jgi:alpha-N-arabinofuranosidase
MGQGARVSRNLFDNNSQDMFFEVDHGPILVDNNLLLSARSLDSRSRGVALVHNLVGGTVNVNGYDGRQTPFHKAHSTELAGFHDNPRGDDRYYNNVFVQYADLSQYDSSTTPVAMNGNVFFKGARPSKFEAAPLVRPDFDPGLRLIQEPGGWHLEINLDQAGSAAPARQTVTTQLLGRAAVPNVAFEQPDGSPICINRDYFGQSRNESNPTPGPFENPGQEPLKLKVR